MGQVERIFALLKEKKIDQKDFASMIGVSEDTVSNWKRGKSESYSKYLPQIADALGTSVEYLLTGTHHTDRYKDILPPEDIKILRQIHDRPGLRIMFDLNAKATDADIEKAVEILKAYYGIREEHP